MIIKPKIPIFADGNQLPSTVSWTDPNSTWYTRSGNGILNGTYNMLKSLHDKWKASGKDEDFQAFKRAVDNLNTTQREGYAPGHLKYESGGDQLFRGNNTAAWQNFVRNNYKFVNDAIGQDFEKKYFVTSQAPNSGDDPNKKWMVDDLWAGITDDRTTWGHLKNPNDPNYLEWKKKFNEIGIDYKVGPDEWKTGNVLYGFLREPEAQKQPSYFENYVNNKLRSIHPLGTLQGQAQMKEPQKQESSVDAVHKDHYGFDWNKIREGAQKILTNPNLYATGRLIGNLLNNERVYDEALKGISPVLKQTYNTHRQIVGDEATKQSYYRRAAQGQTKAAQPFTSDADKQMAYQFEAKRVGDELRAQGDLADNQEIRRTSDESNQHQWNNAQRAVEVANANLASINQANSLRHNLLAQKHSAQWSSIDNYLQGIESRKRQKQAEQQSLDDQIFTLQEKSNLASDKEYIDAYNKYSKIIDANTDKTTGTITWNNTTLAAKREFEKAQTEAIIRSYQRRKQYYGSIFAKSGTKITKKKKDDLLYKSARDTVEHFRKMSKMSSDAQNRKTPKIEKLTSHPKGNTRKYQQGGTAPFTIYKPVALGGEITTSTQTDTTSSKSSKKDGSDTLDMIKELFKQVIGKGLPSDVNNLYVSMQNFLSRAKAFGEDISTEDIASMYLSNMQKLNQIEYLKGKHDEASKAVNENDAVNEFAVDYAGRLVGQKDGKIVYIKSLKDAEEKGVNPLTNGQLLQLRAINPELAGSIELDQIAANGIGMSKIGAFLKAQLPSLGSSEKTIEGYTKKESNDIKAGLQLLKDAPDGDYKYSQYTKSQQDQAKVAINYLKGILPSNMKKVIETRAELGGLSVDGLIGSLVASNVSENSKLEFDAVTGKAGDKNKEGDLDKLGINSATQLLLGMSSPREFTFSIGNGNMFNGMARVSSITKDGNSMGADFTYSDIYKSDLHKNLDLDNASFGDIPINKALKDRIVIDNSTIAGVDLPYTTDRNGRIIPDFKMLNRIEEADQEILKAGINPETEPQKVNEIYAKHNLPIKYGIDNRLTGNYKRFAVIQATAIEDIFLDKSGLASNGTVSLVSDEEEINKYINEIKKTTGQKEIDMDRPGLGTGDKDVYKGSIFIPIIGDLVDAVSATGGLNAGNYDELRSKYQTKNYNEAPQFVKQ